jgi:hypothetical protein
VARTHPPARADIVGVLRSLDPEVPAGAVPSAPMEPPGARRAPVGLLSGLAAHPPMPLDASLFARIADAIETDWRSIARPEQLPPPGDWSTFLCLGGRGAGKTRAAAEWVRGLAEAASVARIALVGPTAADARDAMVEGEWPPRHYSEQQSADLRAEQASADVAERRHCDALLERGAGTVARPSIRGGVGR